MRRLVGFLVSAVVAVAGVGVMTAPKVLAAEGDCIRTSVLGTDGCVENEENGGAMFGVLSLVLQILTFGIGIVGTFAIVISGIQYMTAKDNAGQMAAAKTRLIATAVGLIAYALLWAFLQWVLPGGVFNNS